MNELVCNVQKYGWGRKGGESRVAQFKKSQSDEFEIDESARYAELWMGTHSNCPSEIKLADGKRLLLSEYLKQRGIECLGDPNRVNVFFGDELSVGDLPFLFKVLSINQALSIQAHPNKQHARQLHARDPKNYPDANHKPEMLVAISDGFEALCGFRPASEIAANFKTLPELADLCDQTNANKFVQLAENEAGNTGELEKTLRVCFESLMTCGEEKIKKNLDQLKTRILADATNTSQIDSVFLRVCDQYPGDVGCFSIYLLNYMQLAKGEAIFLAANIPHAYLFGDGVECMACSDNVVRAGLTPKFKDVSVLISMLDYRMRSVDENKLKPESVTSNLAEFKPTVDEFSIQQIRCNTDLDVPPMSTASILIVVENSFDLNESWIGPKSREQQQKFSPRPGRVYFIEPNTEICFHAGSKDNKSSFLAYRAFIDIKS